MNIIQYIQQVSYQYTHKHGPHLADFLSLRHAHVHNIDMRQLENIDSSANVVAMYADEALRDIIISHLRCIRALRTGDYGYAYNEQSAVLQNFIKLFQFLKEENWLLPVMNTLCFELRLLATKVDFSSTKQSLEGSKPREALEKAAEVLMACFRICSSDNRTSEYDTKKWGMMSLVNQLFKLYFRINKLHLMKPLIRAIDSSPLKDKFPLSQQITFKYYVGRKATYDSDYALANQYLSFAFERCHKKFWKNKRLILIYLVPVKILLGYLPSKSVLQKYDLLELWPIGETVKSGNLKALEEAIHDKQEFFIKSGIYLILEKLKSVAYRNLFKRVYIILKTPVIHLESFLVALHLSESEDIELEEANCILANLIYQGKIKGYISLAHQKLVLSKTDPFPKLSTLI